MKLNGEVSQLYLFLIASPKSGAPWPPWAGATSSTRIRSRKTKTWEPARSCWRKLTAFAGKPSRQSPVKKAASSKAEKGFRSYFNLSSMEKHIFWVKEEIWRALLKYGHKIWLDAFQFQNDINWFLFCILARKCYLMWACNCSKANTDYPNQAAR